MCMCARTKACVNAIARVCVRVSSLIPRLLLLNPLKCPPGFCPHVSAEFPRIHSTIQTPRVRALRNAFGLTGAPTVRERTRARACMCEKTATFWKNFGKKTLCCGLREGESETRRHLTSTHTFSDTRSAPTCTLRVTCAVCTHSPWHPHNHPHTHVHSQIALTLYPPTALSSLSTHPPSPHKVLW